VENKTDWEKRKTGVTVIALLVVALDILALSLGTLIDAVPIALSIGCIGIITFVGVLMLTNYLSHNLDFAKKEMRKALAASFTMVYLIFLALVVFGEASTVETETAKTIVGHFTWVVGVIITFYFGSRLREEWNKGGVKEKTPEIKPSDEPAKKSYKIESGIIAKGIFKFIDGISMPLEKIWHILTSVSRLTPEEIKEAKRVFKEKGIRYDAVRVAQGRLLTFVFRINNNRAFTTGHSINIPKSGSHSRYIDCDIKKPRLDLIIHELTHVYQFESIGSIYMYEAIRAQRSKEGYTYGEGPGEWKQLKVDREEYRMSFKNYNREQQAQITQDYYRFTLWEEGKDRQQGAEEKEAKEAYDPFIKDLQNGFI
jgi:hypothetical protein